MPDASAELASEADLRDPHQPSLYLPFSVLAEGESQLLD